jgi:hypothetical protein
MAELESLFDWSFIDFKNTLNFSTLFLVILYVIVFMIMNMI